MKVTVAKNAGFCFGVKRATDSLENAINNAKNGERIYTLGHLIHNNVYNGMLAKRGVKVTNIEEVEDIAATSAESSPVTVFIRAHGIPKEDEELVRTLAERYPHFRYVDCTCPYVKKIHKIADENSGDDSFFLLYGAKEHPEVVGIMSYAECEKAVFADTEELEKMLSDGSLMNLNKKTPVIASQTTQKLSEWKKSQKIFKKLYTNAQIFDTICSVTEKRQSEAEELSKSCNLMIVIGGKDSSNTAKLYAVCKRNCSETIWIESPDEL